MCLCVDVTKHYDNKGILLPRTATEDITVYKILFIDTFNLCIATPYVRFKVASDISHLPNTVLKATMDHNISIAGPDACRVIKGIHSFVDFDTAKASIHTFANTFYFMVACIIPKGTKYYLGIDRDIVSEKLIVKKIL